MNPLNAVPRLHCHARAIRPGALDGIGPPATAAGGARALRVAELRTHPGAEAGVKACVRFYLRWVSAERAAASFLLAGRPDDQAALRERNRGFFAEVTAWWDTHVHYGVLRSLPFDLINALWLGPAHEYARHWHAGRAKRVPTSVADALADAAWQALKEAR